MDVQLFNGDCLEVMRSIPDGSMDAIITDPPYFQIKGGFDWDYKDFNHYLEFMENCAIEWKRLLKKNGSLLVFGHAKRIAYTQVILDKYFNLENNLVWDVYDRQTKKGIDQFRCFAPITERILFYSREVERTGLEEIKLNTDNFTTLRGYFKQVQEFIGTGKNIIIEKIGQKADHCFRHSSTQWDLPTAETYAQLISVFGIDKMDGFKEYESLRLEYESLRLEYESLRLEYESLRLEYESLRRPFNNVHRLTDVIKHSQESHITRHFKHDTVKPIGLMSKLIETVTTENSIVLDCFLGSGTTGAACVNLNRSFIGIELDKSYFDIAKNRIETAQQDLINKFGEVA